MTRKTTSSTNSGEAGVIKKPRTARPKAAGVVKKAVSGKALAAAASAGTSAAQTVYEKDEIARLAYTYWEQRGGLGGSPEDDWLRAEQEVRERKSAHNGS